MNLGAVRCSSATATMNLFPIGRSSIILAEVYFNLRKILSRFSMDYSRRTQVAALLVSLYIYDGTKTRESSCTGPQSITKRLCTTNCTRSRYSVAFATRTPLCSIVRLDIQSFNQALFVCLDLKRQEFRVNATQRQAAAHEPQLWVSGRSPHLHK